MSEIFLKNCRWLPREEQGMAFAGSIQMGDGAAGRVRKTGALPSGRKFRRCVKMLDFDTSPYPGASMSRMSGACLTVM